MIQMARCAGALSRQDRRRVRGQPRRAHDAGTQLVEVSFSAFHLFRRRRSDP